MTTPPITLRMDHNEKGSGRDLAVMTEVARHPEWWDFDFDDIGLDLLFALGDREIRWELKTPADWLSSAQGGHLAMQLMQAGSSGHPAYIAVLGPNMEVLECIPKVKKQSGYVKRPERAEWEAAIERWEADCFGAGFPVHYFHGGIDNSIRRICRWSRSYLVGSTRLPLPKAPDYQMYCLMGLPGVGPETARAMLSRNIVPWIAKTNDRGEMWSVSEERLMEIPGIGKKKAEKILKALEG